MRDITRHRVYLFVDRAEDPHSDAARIEAWLRKWGASVASSKELEYGFDIEAPLVALQELPKRLFFHGTGITYPRTEDGVLHPEWKNHFDDGRSMPWPGKADA